MKSLFTAAAIAAGLSLMPAVVGASERPTDAAAGALAGAIVAGPVGLVAGGVIGFTGGPHISCRLGINKCGHRARRVRHAPRDRD